MAKKRISEQEDEELRFQRYQFEHLEGATYPWWHQHRDEEFGERHVDRLIRRSDTPLKKNRKGVDAR